MEIKIKELRKSFPNKGLAPLVVLRNINLAVPAGNFVSIIGPSGCGKTTLLKIIAGLEKADAGDIEISPESVSPSIPIIWQEHRLFPWRTVLKNLAFPLELRKVGREQAEVAARQLLQKLNLEEFANYYPWQLSGGMAHLASIGRALTINSQCLLMDEPFASVDYQAKHALFRRVKEIQSEKGSTIIYVTHDVRDAIQYSDRIAVLSARPSSVLEFIKPTPNDLSHSALEEHIWELLIESREVAQNNLS